VKHLLITRKYEKQKFYTEINIDDVREHFEDQKKLNDSNNIIPDENTLKNENL